MTNDEILAARRRFVGGNVSVGYRRPLQVVRGSMQYLFDETGRRYIDAYNNVPHVGHCHPRVVEAAERQLRALNTNTRYLDDHLARYAERLASTLPEPLRICYFVNSGSEANELALRLARAHTGHRDLIVLDAAYHGNTTTLIDISPYKFNGPGGTGKPSWVHVVPIPDVYRWPSPPSPPATSVPDGTLPAPTSVPDAHLRPPAASLSRRSREAAEAEADAGATYADAVATSIDQLRAGGAGVCGFIAESCPSVGGQITFPPGYLAAVYGHVRGAGGVCIADEVQTGYGRIGTHFYAFEEQGVIPDIVVLGKPIGNGYPIGAVVTTPEIAASFDNGMEFFSTFGGSTVSCAVGLTVLEVVEDERLQAHAQEVGECLLGRLRPLVDRSPLVGDVRGSGLFIGVELVRDRETLEPAAAEASDIANRLREEGILIGTDGPCHSVLKIRPPMPFSIEDADVLASALELALARQ